MLKKFYKLILNLRVEVSTSRENTVLPTFYKRIGGNTVELTAGLDLIFEGSLVGAHVLPEKESSSL
ncbi:hypothetical protein D918_02262 [Trichuris suis]|nr:hypothetical protein D918_02262 [Trichuris suis]